MSSNHTHPCHVLFECILPRYNTVYNNWKPISDHNNYHINCKYQNWKINNFQDTYMQGKWNGLMLKCLYLVVIQDTMTYIFPLIWQLKSSLLLAQSAYRTINSLQAFMSRINVEMQLHCNVLCMECIISSCIICE